MRKKYKDCQRADGNCSVCPMVSLGLDCHKEKIAKIEWHRLAAKMTQKELAEASGVYIRKIQSLEAGDIKVENLTLAVALKLADALDIDVRELLG